MEHFAIDSFNYGKKDALKDDVLAGLTAETITKPLFFFIEEWDEDLVTLIIQKLKTLNLPVENIKDDYVKLKTRQSAIEALDAGAVILATKFGRGINLRFAVDAHVIVIANG
jgi:hypothetical protein